MFGLANALYRAPGGASSSVADAGQNIVGMRGGGGELRIPTSVGNNFKGENRVPVKTDFSQLRVDQLREAGILCPGICLGFRREFCLASS